MELRKYLLCLEFLLLLKGKNDPVVRFWLV